MNRREFLRSTSIVAVAAGVGLTSVPKARAAESEAVFALDPAEAGAPNLDPIRAGFLNSVAFLVYDRLIERDQDQTYHPHLAETWETSADGLLWTFKLRQGVRFHDGEPFNAATISWWVSKYKGTANENMTDAIDRVEAVDEHTVRFVMKRPDPNLINNLASEFMGIPSPKSYDAAGDSYGVTEAIGTGPYKLESFAVGRQTVVVANEAYSWASDLSLNKGAPFIKRLTLREIPDASTAFLELKTGGVGVLLGVTTDFLPQLQADKNIEFRTLPGFGVSYLMFNTQAAPFTDRTIRQAVALAVDQSAIRRSVFGGTGLDAHQFLISTLAESKVDPQYEIRHDAETANALLDSAGWPRGSDGIRAKNGKPLKVSLTTQSETTFKRTAEIVQAQLKAVGIDSEIVLFDTSTIRDELRKGQHQLVVTDYGWANADILDWCYSAKNIPYPNSAMWNDAKSEELDNQAMNASTTWKDRVQNFIKYHEYLLSQFVFAPIHEPVQSVAFNKTLLELPEKLHGLQSAQLAITDMKTRT